MPGFSERVICLEADHRTKNVRREVLPVRFTWNLSATRDVGAPRPATSFARNLAILSIAKVGTATDDPIGVGGRPLPPEMALRSVG